MQKGKDSVLVAIVTTDGYPLIVFVREPGQRAPIYDKLLGGEVEDGESPLQAGIREVKEEADIDLMACELSLQSATPLEGRTGKYTQYLYLALVPSERVARHMGRDVVTCVDPEGKRLESTCYDLARALGMSTTMPKHKGMLIALVPQQSAA